MEWDQFSYQPEVGYRIAHSDSLLFLKYYVKEEHILAQRKDPNSAVHRDSCVEFFIDPLQDGTITILNLTVSVLRTLHMVPVEGSELLLSLN